MQLTLIPHVPGDDDDTVITFTADARDTATLIHAYCVAASRVTRLSLTRGTRTMEIETARIICQPSQTDDCFSNVINYLFPDDSY